MASTIKIEPKQEPVELQPVIIVRNYAPDQEGMDIREEDVIRAGNGKYYSNEEIPQFSRKSAARCPTYGNCKVCWKSGPVGKRCNYITCTGNRGAIYVVTYVLDDTRGKRHTMDAENLATLVHRPHEVAKADGTMTWLSPPSQSYELSHFLQVVVQKQFQYRHTGLERNLDLELFGEPYVDLSR